MRTKHAHGYPATIKRYSDRFIEEDHDRLDIEAYDQPTEMPDIDNFDYGKERESERAGEIRDELESNYGDDKIVGGVEVDINLYPYHVAYGTNCGGAIIDRRFILTAGHCG